MYHATNQFKIQGRLVVFLNLNKKTCKNINTMLLTALDRHKISLANCWAQAYDNGSASILEKNNLAFYLSYSAHFLNPVSVIE